MIAAKLGRVLELDPDSIFVGNGAVEIIQAILHRFTREKILVNLPTFSPVLRVRPARHTGRLQRLAQRRQFPLQPGAYLDLVRRERPDTVVLINPNNPDGGYIPHAVMRRMLEELRIGSQRHRRRELYPFRLRGRRLSLPKRGGPGRTVAESDSRQEHVQRLRRGRDPGRIRGDGPRPRADAARERLSVEFLGHGRVLLRPLFAARFPGAVSSESASGSSATRGDFSVPWPRSTGCTYTRRKPTLLWSSFAAH